MRRRVSIERPLRRALPSVACKVVALSLTFIVSCTALVAANPATSAAAIDPADFDPGYIISDDLFYDGAAMSSVQIQSFLDEKIGTCLTDRCLNVAVLPVASRAASYSSSNGALLCQAIEGGNLRVSELIYRTQVACGISAKVILVTLQKEQGLVTSRAPTDRALRAAMGMGCPDTAPCNDAFYGLAIQIMSGTKQLITYRAGQFARQPGVHYIQFNPNPDCGGTNVTVRNYATAALYNYTPYQPNSAALANIGSTGDACSSYGNRNFWAFYTNWFGPPTEIPCTVNPSRDIARYWEEQGGAGGTYGALVPPGIVAGGGETTVGSYANGDIYCTPRIGAVGVVGELSDKYTQLGGPGGAIGSPTSARTTFSAAGITGFVQYFQRGLMLTSSSTGTHAVVKGPIRDAWGLRGGSGGVLGWPTGDVQTSAAGMTQKFQNGVLSVADGQAAIVLSGEVGAFWAADANATSLGLPTTSAVPYSAGGVTGTLQHFAGGMVLSSSATGTHSVLNGPVRSRWGALNGTAGVLGWPTGDAQQLAGGQKQDFQGGTIFVSSTGVGATMPSEIADYWAAGTNAVKLGFPSSGNSAWSAGGVSGSLQYFELGMVLSSAQTGTYSVLNGPIRSAWGGLGGTGGALGWPVGDQQIVAGELRQQFQRGSLAIPTGLSGEIATYVGTGANAVRLGAPTGAASAWTAGGVTGQLQYFQRGLVMSSAATGTHAVFTGAIRDAWGVTGGSGGTLGWPIGEQLVITGGIKQEFQNGVIVAMTGRPGAVLSGDFATYWDTGSNAALLGYPTTSSSAWSAGGVSGQIQYFEKGMVLASAATGMHAVVVGKVRDAWAASGGSGGSLGWPTSEPTSFEGGVQQQFQRGLVIAPISGPASVLSGDFAAYWAAGSNSSLLGAPTTSAMAWNAGGVTGQLQYFQKGLVLSSAATGTHGVINGPMRNAWGAQDGTAGTLGWPIGDQETVDGMVRQLFQKGTLTISTAGTVVLLSTEIYQYWAAGANAVTIGSPTAAKVAWSANGVTGFYQTFTRGLVMSSPTTGTFVVLDGAIRTVWGGAGGSGGTLGWPTGDQTTVAEGVRQQFQFGAVVVPTSGEPYITTP